MTGLVERSSNKYFNFQTTHLAFVRRHQQRDHHFSEESSKNNHFNFLTSLELNKMLPNTHTTLDNQLQSAHKLKQNLSSRRCESTSSDSSTSTFVEDGLNNDEYDNNLSHDDKRATQPEHEFAIVLPLSFSKTNFGKLGKNQIIASENEKSSTSSKKCCSVPCIDSMSTVSSVCSPCPAPISNCLKKSPLPFKKDSPSCIKGDDSEQKETMQTRKPSSSMHSIAKANFTHLIRIPSRSFSPYKGMAEDPINTCKNGSNKVQIPNSRVHQILRSPFKEWLL